MGGGGRGWSRVEGALEKGRDEKRAANRGHDRLLFTGFSLKFLFFFLPSFFLSFFLSSYCVCVSPAVRPAESSNNLYWLLGLARVAFATGALDIPI